MTVTHPFVSAVVDDGTPTGAVGPDEWNDDHTVDISFLDLNDVPATYTGHAGEFVIVNGSGNALTFSPTPSGNEGGGSGFAELRPGTANAMDDEFDDTTGSSGTINGLNAKWTLRGANAPTLTYPASSWAKFVANTTTFGYDQAIPAAQNYTVEARLGIGGAVGDSNSFGGLLMYDAVNGDLYAFYLLVGNNSTRVFDIEVSKWGASGTFFGGAFTNLKSLTSAPPPNAFRVVYTNSSTQIDFEASYDGGLTWVNIWTEATDAIGHTRVGFFKTYDVGSANQRTLTIDWFRRTV